MNKHPKHLAKKPAQSGFTLVEIAIVLVIIGLILGGVLQGQVMIENAKSRNPHGRLTLPEDVADAMIALSTPATRWITGNTIYIDGGEIIGG